MKAVIASLVCLIALSACGSSSPPASVPDASPSDKPADTSPVDLGSTTDVPSPTDAPVDAPLDVAVKPDGTMDATPPVDRVPSGCRAQADCASHELGHVCDTATGQCVPCTPTQRGDCRANEYCTAANRCETGCGADTDCAGDGGMLRCDLARHVCARCVTDDHCPAGEVCRLGDCVAGCTSEHACPMSQACCGGMCLDVSADPTHCGSCTTVCMAGENSTATCAMGRCGLACAAGFADCDTSAANGCEAALNGSSNCGMCGMACAGGTPLCTRTTEGALVCGTGCASGQLRCGAECVDPQSDANHCGMCGMACAAGVHATRACLMGACGLVCDAGFADCDRSAANGCETDTRANTMNCGACGTVCTAGPNATASCAMGRCQTACADGFADCDGNAVNGCETNTRTSAANCGACGRTCPDAASSTATCTMGTCGITCNMGFADCDMSAANGCEASLTATTSCGRCGNACSAATPVCSAMTGACVSGCATGQLRCGLSCEDPQTSVSHCGGCDMACPEPARALRTCTAGRCGFACESGYGDCDRAAANGCEENLQTSAQHCGACGMACAPGLGCRGGVCTPTYTSCKEILDAGLSRGDGVYTILVSGRPTDVRCLMSADGGGWTLVGNFPYPGNTAGVAGWSSGARVGTAFTDVARVFKLSDAEINALRTNAFRARGTATRCTTGACSINTTLYWRPTCTYASGSNSPACYTAYRDVNFTMLQSSAAPCSWHWGLGASDCVSRSTIGTSHVGDHVFVGDYVSYTHAYDGRAGEDPSVQFWVR